MNDYYKYNYNCLCSFFTVSSQTSKNKIPRFPSSLDLQSKVPPPGGQLATAAVNDDSSKSALKSTTTNKRQMIEKRRLEALRKRKLSELKKTNSQMK